MKSIASKKAGPGCPSSYISHNLTRLYMHCNFGLGQKKSMGINTYFLYPPRGRHTTRGRRNIPFALE